MGLNFRAGFDLALRWLAIGLTAALLVCVMLGVITRALNNPLIWTDEVSRFLMVWLAVFGWMLASRRRAHIRIRFFQDLLPGQPRKFFEIAIQCGVVVLGVLLTGYGVELVVRNHDLEALTIPISMSWLYAPMVLAGIVTTVQACGEIARDLRRRRPLSSIDDGLVE